MEKFWNDYIKGDYFERKKILSTLLPVFDSFLKDIGDDNYAFFNLLQSYFDDLIEVLRKSGLR